MQRRYLSTQSHAAFLTRDGQPIGDQAGLGAAHAGLIAPSAPPPVSNVSWKTAVSGDWNTATDWTGGAVPGSSNDVTIGVAGAYTVTIDSSQAAHSLTVSDASGTVADNAGALALTTKLSLTGGTLALSNAGAISGGTLAVGTGTTLLSDGTSTISSSVTSTGLISVSAGDLILNAGGALGGTLSGAGTLELNGGTAFTIGAAGLAGSGNLADVGAVLNFAASGSVSTSVAVGGNGTLSASAGRNGTITGALTIGEPAATYTGDAYLLGTGTLTTTGVTTVADYTTNAELFLGTGITWVNGGTVNDGGYGYLNNVGSDTVTIVNQAGASFNFTTDDANLVQYNGGNDTFTNAGTLAKTGGTGTSILGAAVNSTGVIMVASGVLDLTDGGTLGGMLNGAGTLELSGGVFSVGASGIGGAGSVEVYGATLNFSGTGSVSTSVAVGGNGTLSASAGKNGTISGALTIGEPAATYTGDAYLLGAGTLTTTGVTTVADYTTNAELFLGTRITWVNGGTVNDGGYGYLNNVGSDTVTIVNQAGASFNFTTDDANLVQYNGGTDTFTNAGTLAKTGGTGTSTLQAAVNSTGVISVTSGVLDLTYGGSIGGTVSGSGTLELGAGSFGASGGIAGSGNIAITAASLNFSGSGTVSASVAINGGGDLSVGAGVHTTLSGPLSIGSPAATYNGDGYLTGPGTLTTSGVTTIADYNTNAELFLGGGITWVNSGTVNDGGYGYMNTVGIDSVTIINQAGASFNLTTDDANLVPYNGGTDTFTNAGTLAKTGGSGLSALYLAMTNSGTISAASGTLQLESTLSNTGLLLATNGGVLDLSPATLSNITGATLAGGSYEADAGSIIELSNSTSITTDSANITLSGVGSSIQAFNGATQVTLDSTLSSISSSGTLNLLNGRNFTVAANGGTLSLAGLLNLGGVKFSATKLAITAAGTASGYGTIATAVTDAGTISAAGGTLLLSGAVTGAGALRAAAGATVELTKGNTLTETISGAGTLELSGVTPYTLAGATVSIAAVIIDTGATLSGTGTLTGSVADAGTLTATGGSLIVDGALTGAGAVQIATASVLDLAGGGSFAGSVGGAGTLKLDGSNPFVMQAGATLTAGTVLVDAGATLDLNSGGALTGTISGAGTLQLDGATPYTVAAGTPFNFGAVVVDAGATLDLNIGGALTGNIGGAGTLELGGPIAYSLAGVTESIAALALDTGTTLSGNGVIAGSVVDSGTLAASGGVLTIDGAVSGAGALQAAAGTTLDLAGGGSFSGAISGAGTLQLDGANALVLQSAASLTVAKVVVDAGSTLDLTQGGALSGSLTGAGTLQLDGATAYTLAAGITLGIGTVAVDAGAALSGAGTLSGALIDNGTVSVSAGTLVVGGALSGAGTLSATTGKVLDLAGGGNFAGKVSGTGSLRLDGANAFTLAGASVSMSAVTVDAGAILAGFGTVSGALTDSGTIIASGGRLLLSGAIGGSGTMQALAGATLDLTAGGVLAQAISGAGTLELGGAYTLGAHVPTIANLTVDAGASLSGIGRYTGALLDNGMVSAVGGTLTLGGAISGKGTLSAAAGAVLDLSKGGTFGGAIAGAGTVLIDGATTLSGTASLTAANVIETAGLKLGAGVDLSVAGGSDFTITAAAGKTVKLTGAGADTYSNAGSLLANGAGTADLNIAFINSANVSVGSGTLAFLKAVTNNGTIDTGAATVSIKTDVGGTGMLSVEAGGTLSLLAGSGVGQTVDFLGATGLVDLTKPLSFDGTVAGFGGGDQIDLIKTAETSFNFAGGVLTVMDGSHVVANLNFAGSGYSNSTFMFQSDGHQGTLLTFV